MSGSGTIAWQRFRTIVSSREYLSESANGACFGGGTLDKTIFADLFFKHAASFSRWMARRISSPRMFGRGILGGREQNIHHRDAAVLLLEELLPALPCARGVTRARPCAQRGSRALLERGDRRERGFVRLRQ